RRWNGVLSQQNQQLARRLRRSLVTRIPVI
ncbi:MAG: hypothetical protein ACI8X5_003278, partial [Planctomycetota bacterium]